MKRKFFLRTICICAVLVTSYVLFVELNANSKSLNNFDYLGVTGTEADNAHEELRKLGIRSLPPLVSALDDSSELVRLDAVQMIEHIGLDESSEPEKLVENLKALVNDKSKEVRLASLKCLITISRCSEDELTNRIKSFAAEDLLNLMDVDFRNYDRKVLARALGAKPSQFFNVEPLIRERFDSSIRYAYYSEIIDSPLATNEILIEFLQNPSTRIQLLALNFLRTEHNFGKSIVPKYQSQDVSKILMQIGSKSEIDCARVAFEVLAYSFTNKDVELLSSWLRILSIERKIAVVDSLKHNVGIDTPQIAQLLSPLFNLPEPRLHEALVRVAGVRQVRQLAPKVVYLLGSKVPLTQLAAAGALKSLDVRGNGKEIIAALLQSKRPTHFDSTSKYIRAILVNLLIQENDRDMVESLAQKTFPQDKDLTERINHLLSEIHK